MAKPFGSLSETRHLTSGSKSRGSFTSASSKRANAAKKRREEGAEVALKLISDPVYRKNLKQRLRDGTAGQMENLLWLLAYGKPREQAKGENIEARLIEVREAAVKAIKAQQRPSYLPAHVVEGEVVNGGNGSS